jgi:hypothetical protein
VVQLDHDLRGVGWTACRAHNRHPHRRQTQPPYASTVTTRSVSIPTPVVHATGTAGSHSTYERQQRNTAHQQLIEAAIMPKLTSKIIVALVLAFTAAAVAGCVPTYPVNGTEYI